jgi:hypothetical protein
MCLFCSMRILRYTDDLFLHIPMCILVRRCVCIFVAVTESLVRSNDDLVIHLFAFSGAVFVSPSLYPNLSSDLLIHLYAFSGAVYVSPSLYPNPSSPSNDDLLIHLLHFQALCMYLHRCIQIPRLQQQRPITTPPPTRDSQPHLSLSWSPMQVCCTLISFRYVRNRTIFPKF